MAISAREKLLVVAPDTDNVKARLGRVNEQNIFYVRALNNDTWARDHGAITVLKNGGPVILDFTFNGWGLKFASNFDNRITRTLFDAGVFSASVRYENRLNFVLEGGSIESDGKGTLLTTSECLLSINRNGEWSKQQIEDYLKEQFGLSQILWLDHGFLAGDDTDSHIDTLARLCPSDRIVYVKCDDPTDEHYDELRRMEEQLLTFMTPDGRNFELVPVPLPDAIIRDGERLPATYANFLIINGAVLLPIYGQPQNDAAAHEALSSVFPGREIVPIDCSVLIRQHGSLHCVTMQFPEGVL
jgi:agmatine/peptidylarginine deiminase